MRILLIVNSFASSVTARNRVIIEQIFQDAGHDVTLRETNRRGHATRFAHDAANRGVDIVVALGGDGTVNEVANGLVGSPTALGVLPGGSTNVFARTIGLPNDPVEAAGRLVATIKSRPPEPTRLGRVNGRYFCFHTGIGYDAAVVAAVERHATVKRWLGHPLFVWAAQTTFARGYDRKRPHFRLNIDGEVIDDGYFTVVLNTNPYTYLGNRALDLVPGKGLDSPLLVVTFTNMRVLTLVGGLGAALAGRGIKGSGVDVRRQVQHLVIESDRPFPYQLDGDHLGDTQRLEFDSVPEALRLVLPR